jgi:hypothetical protein
VFALLLDLIKVPVFRRLQIAPPPGNPQPTHPRPLPDRAGAG